MSANTEQIKKMLERTGTTNLSQKQKVDLDKEQLQLEATYIQKNNPQALVEEEETIVKQLRNLSKKGKRCMQQAVEDQEQENYIFWDGFHNCAEGILREVENSTEGIKGNLEEIPSNVDLEKEIQRYLCEECSSDDEPTIKEIAHHFYKLGLNARKQ